METKKGGGAYGCWWPWGEHKVLEMRERDLIWFFQGNLGQKEQPKLPRRNTKPRNFRFFFFFFFCLLFCQKKKSPQKKPPQNKTKPKLIYTLLIILFPGLVSGLLSAASLTLSSSSVDFLLLSRLSLASPQALNQTVRGLGSSTSASPASLRSTTVASVQARTTAVLERHHAALEKLSSSLYVAPNAKNSSSSSPAAAQVPVNLLSFVNSSAVERASAWTDGEAVGRVVVSLGVQLGSSSLYFVSVAGPVVAPATIRGGEAVQLASEPRWGPGFRAASAVVPRRVVIVVEMTVYAMEDEVIDIAVEAARGMVRMLSPLDFVSVVAYSEGDGLYEPPCLPGKPAVRATAPNVEAMLGFIADLPGRVADRAVKPTIASARTGHISAIQRAANISALDLSSDAGHTSCVTAVWWITKGGPANATVGAAVAAALSPGTLLATFTVGRGAGIKAVKLAEGVSCQVAGSQFSTIESSQGMASQLAQLTRFYASDPGLVLASLAGSTKSSPGPPTVSEPHISLILPGGVPVVTVATPVYNKTDPQAPVFLGVAAVDIPLSELTAAARGTFTSPGDYVFIYDSAGRVLHHPLVANASDPRAPMIVDVEGALYASKGYPADLRYGSVRAVGPISDASRLSPYAGPAMKDPAARQLGLPPVYQAGMAASVSTNYYLTLLTTGYTRNVVYLALASAAVLGPGAPRDPRSASNPVVSVANSITSMPFTPGFSLVNEEALPLSSTPQYTSPAGVAVAPTRIGIRVSRSAFANLPGTVASPMPAALAAGIERFILTGSDTTGATASNVDPSLIGVKLAPTVRTLIYATENLRQAWSASLPSPCSSADTCATAAASRLLAVCPVGFARSLPATLASSQADGGPLQDEWVRRTVREGVGRPVASLLSKSPLTGRPAAVISVGIGYAVSTSLFTLVPGFAAAVAVEVDAVSLSSGLELALGVNASIPCGYASSNLCMLLDSVGNVLATTRSPEQQAGAHISAVEPLVARALYDGRVLFARKDYTPWLGGSVTWSVVAPTALKLISSAESRCLPASAVIVYAVPLAAAGATLVIVEGYGPAGLGNGAFAGCIALPAELQAGFAPAPGTCPAYSVNPNFPISAATSAKTACQLRSGEIKSRARLPTPRETYTDGFKCQLSSKQRLTRINNSTEVLVVWILAALVPVVGFIGYLIRRKWKKSLIDRVSKKRDRERMKLAQDLGLDIPTVPDPVPAQRQREPLPAFVPPRRTTLPAPPPIPAPAPMPMAYQRMPQQQQQPQQQPQQPQQQQQVGWNNNYNNNYNWGQQPQYAPQQQRPQGFMQPMPVYQQPGANYYQPQPVFQQAFVRNYFFDRSGQRRR
jgi:hypothetical protein